MREGARQNPPQYVAGTAPARILAGEPAGTLFLAHGARCVDLVAQYEEGHFCELLDCKEGIQLGL